MARKAPRIGHQPDEQTHPELLAGFLQVAAYGPNTATDAHIGALAIEHNAVVPSNDRIFTRFPGIRLHNPVT